MGLFPVDVEVVDDDDSAINAARDVALPLSSTRVVGSEDASASRTGGWLQLQSFTSTRIADEEGAVDDDAREAYDGRDTSNCTRRRSSSVSSSSSKSARRRVGKRSGSGQKRRRREEGREGRGTLSDAAKIAAIEEQYGREHRDQRKGDSAMWMQSRLKDQRDVYRDARGDGDNLAYGKPARSDALKFKRTLDLAPRWYESAGKTTRSSFYGTQLLQRKWETELVKERYFAKEAALRARDRRAPGG